MTISQYYKYYLTLHEHPKCRLLHFIGQWMTLLFISFVIYKKLWWFLIISPFIIYPFAWSGHYFFENNRPAAFNEPLKAKISDWLMFKDIILRRLKIW